MKDFRINIVELGPIKNASIRLAPLMIFTGESSLGKSYVNFLSYYVFDLFGNNGLGRFLAPKIAGKKWKDKKISFGFTISELRSWMAEDVKNFMRDLLAFPELECKIDFIFELDGGNDVNVIVRDDGSLNEDAESEMRELSVEVDGQGIIHTWSFNNLPFTISNTVARLISASVLGKVIASAYLLPPGRTSLISNSFSVKKMVSNTGMYDRFLHDYDALQNPGFRFKETKDDNQFFLSQIKKLIHGDVVTEKDETFLLLDNGKKIPMSAAASSIREMSPLLFWIKNKNIELSSVCLEEPEAHAHPEMQYGIADLLVSCINKGAYIQMTTHSDYLLTRINQLIKLYQLHQNHPEKFDNSVFVRNKRQVLNPQDIKAYYFQFSESLGHVSIKEQNLADGIPFDSFHDAIMRQIKFDDDLNLLIGNDNR